MKNIIDIPMKLWADYTQTKRYRPAFELSKKTMIFNLFRLYEQIFGREFGIKRECITYQNEHGKFVSISYTWENALVQIECGIYKFVKDVCLSIFGVFKDVKNLGKIKVYIPQFVTPLGSFPTGFVFAIAYDTGVNAGYSGSSGTTKTWSHTTSGADRLLFIDGLTDSNVVTNMEYPVGTSMTYCTDQDTDYWTSIWGLPNAASGANNCNITCSASVNIIPMSLSYSGCNSTAPSVVARNRTDGVGVASPIALSITTVDDNSWVQGYLRHDAGGASSAGANTRIVIDDGTYALTTIDTNGPKTPAGSITLNVSFPGSGWLAIVAFSPAGGAAVYIPKIMMS